MFHASFNRPRTELRYSLVITFPDGEVHAFPVGEAAITIGRSPATAIRVPEDGVSRQHCVISPAGGRLIVLDQGSTNGTFVNGALIRQARLNDGDVVQVGSTRIRVQAKPVDDGQKIARPTRPEDGVESDADEITTQTYEIPIGTANVVQRLAERLAASDGAVSAAELVLDAVTEVIPVDRAFIITRRPGRHGVVADVLASKTKVPTREATADLDVEVPERLLTTICGDPNLVTAAETTAAARAALSKRISGPILCAPLRQGGEAFGALYLDALTLPEWAQNDEMLGFLSSVGALAALAISRARLHAELNLERRLATQQRQRLAQGEAAEVEPLGKGLERELAEREIDALRKQRRVTAAAALSFLNDIGPRVEETSSRLGIIGRALTDGSDEEIYLLEATAELGGIVQAVKDVATLVELESGTLVLETRQFNAAELLERAVRSLEAKAGEQGVTLRLGSIEGGLQVVADPQVLTRALNHLICDALKHLRRGGRIVLSLRRHAATVEIVVADTGATVDQSSSEEIFEFDGTDPLFDGRIGSVELYFCKLAAEAHGGTLRLTGTDGNHRVVLALPVGSER